MSTATRFLVPFCRISPPNLSYFPTLTYRTRQYFYKKKMKLILAFFLICLGIQTIAQPSSNMNTLKSSGYAPVNGLKMYYEIHGEGRPLVLVHGSYMNINLNYGQLIPILAKTHKIIAFEMQGHGRTADIDRPYSFPALADDIAG